MRENGMMQTLGSNGRPSGRGVSMRMGSAGMAVMLVVFLVAVVFAANQNDVIGWLVAIISLGWLLIFSYVVLSLRSAARKAADRIQAHGGFGSAGAPQAGTAAVDRARDLKLDHSFKIVQVQVGVVREYLGKDAEMVERALETIEITSHNARSMMKGSSEGPVEGTVVD
jgi:Na+/melibiose symporter-like transporter